MSLKYNVSVRAKSIRNTNSATRYPSILGAMSFRNEYDGHTMSGCPSFLPGQGRGGAGRDLSEVDDFLKFVLFFFTVKNPEYKSPQVRCRSQQVPSQ